MGFKTSVTIPVIHYFSYLHNFSVKIENVKRLTLLQIIINIFRKVLAASYRLRPVTMGRP